MEYDDYYELLCFFVQVCLYCLNVMQVYEDYVSYVGFFAIELFVKMEFAEVGNGFGMGFKDLNG